MKDGKIELAKLPENAPDEMKENLKKADKDEDGFVTMEELRANMPRPKFQFQEGKKPDFINDESQIEVEKLNEAIKGLDKNGDGKIDADEQKAISEYVSEKAPQLPFYVTTILMPQPRFGAPGFGQPGFGFGQPGFGGPGFGQPGFGGPRPGFGGQPGFGGGRPEGDRPQPQREGPVNFGF